MAEQTDIFRKYWDAAFPQISENKLLMKLIDRLRITNIVATVNLNVCDINLSEIARRHPFCNYHRGTFAAMGIRIPTPKCSALIYPAGVVVCMGTQSEPNTFLAAQKYVEVLTKFVDIPCKMTGLQFDNYVCSVYTFRLDLANGIRPEWTNVIEYDYKKFPGAIVRCKFMGLPFRTNVHMAFFRSGKINITGARSLYEALYLFVCVYYEYLVHMRLSTRAQPDAPVEHWKMPPVLQADIRPAAVEPNTKWLAKYNQINLLWYLEHMSADRHKGHGRIESVEEDEHGAHYAVHADGRRRRMRDTGLEGLNADERDAIMRIAASTADIDYDVDAAAVEPDYDLDFQREAPDF